MNVVTTPVFAPSSITYETGLPDVPLAVTVVPVIAAGVVPPIAGGEERLSDPPSVTVPVPVIGPPVSVIPLTLPVVFTWVTVPEPPPPVALSVPPANVRLLPIVTGLNPPAPFP